MADMKFGPEWLRALSECNSVTSPPPSPGMVTPKYKLAEHRYGREEMLVLFNPVEKVPDSLHEFPSIVCEKILQPLALLSPTEEEQRLLSSSVNSSVVLRMMGGGRGSAPPLRGRGTSAGPDRGRGRGRGRGDGGFYRDYEDDGFTRPRHGRGTSWGDEGRGFGSRASFEDGHTSPRREFSRSMSTENWRDAKRSDPDQEDGDGGDWRRAGPRDRWSSRNWREPRDRGFDRDFPERGRYDEYDRDRDRGFERPRTYSRSKSYDDEGELPEWSMADADDMECVGTFDSSGAFMSMKGENGQDELTRDEKTPNSNRKVGDKKSLSPPKESENEAKDKITLSESGESAKSQDIQSKESKKSENSETNQAKKTQTTPANGDVPLRAKTKESSVNTQSSSSSSQNKLQEEKKDSSIQKPAEDSRGAIPRSDIKKVLSPVPEPKTECDATGGAPSPVQREEAVLAQQAAASVINNSRAAVTEVTSSQISGPMLNAPTEPDNFDHLEKAAEDLMATWTAEEDEKLNHQAVVESGGVPVDHEDFKRWFYKDPQGDLQGPFSSTEMAEWFSAGYFTMNLLVKRGCDDIFQPLGELIKRWGRVPFLNGPTPPPMKSTAGTPTGNGGMPAVSSMQATQNVTTNPMPAVLGPTPTIPAGAGVEQVLQQQYIIQQQQALYRQLQMQQIMQVLQQQEAFTKLNPAQQQQLCLQLLIKQQQHHLLQQQQAAAAAAGVPGNPNAALSQQPPATVQPNLSPRSQSAEPQVPVGGGGGQPVTSLPGPNPAGHPAGHPGFQRSLSQPGGEAPMNWSSDTSPATSGNWTPQPTSVWDIDQPPKSQAQSFEDIQRLEMERQRRRELEELELQRRKEEEEEMKRREEEERIKVEIERQKELQRQDQIRREQEELVRRQREQEEMARRQREQEEIARRQREEEERRQREEEEQRRIREEEERRKQEEERHRQEEERRKIEEERRRREEEIKRQQELQRQAEEERKRKEQEELERKKKKVPTATLR